MAVTLDIGDAHDIHPREKQEVGRRLALAALKLVYGRDAIASGPTFAAAVRDGKTIKVRFTNVASGLTTSDGAAPRVPDRGRGSLWKAAEARIEGGTSSSRTRRSRIPSPSATAGATTRRRRCAVRPTCPRPLRSDDWANVPATATAK